MVTVRIRRLLNEARSQVAGFLVPKGGQTVLTLSNRCWDWRQVMSMFIFVNGRMVMAVDERIAAR